MKNGTPAFRACDIRVPKLLEVYYPEVKGICLVVGDQLVYRPIISVRVAKAVRSRAAISRSRA